VNKEINAVNSEMQMYLQSDFWKLLQILRSISKKDNPFNKFGVGSLETLKHSSIRDDMIKFYQKHYSSNVMKVVLFSNKSVDEICDMARSAFSKVPNINK